MNCGVYESILSLSPGLQLCGYIARENSASGTHDPLKVKAVYFEQSGEPWLLVSCDLLGMERAVFEKAVRSVQEQTHIPKERISISCTHTHSAPAAMYLAGCGETDSAFVSLLCETIAQAAKKAMQSAVPSHLYLGSGTTGIAVNRVFSQMWGSENTENWETRNWDEEPQEALADINELRNSGVKEEDITDHEVVCLKITDENDKMMVLIVNAACHPVTFEPDNESYSADFFADAERHLNHLLQSNAPVLFLNGCCGDLNPRVRGGEKGATEIGKQLAEDAAQAIKNARLLENRLKVQRIKVTIPLDIDFDKASIANRLTVYKRGKELEEGLSSMIYSVYLNWAEQMIHHMENGTLQRQVRAEVEMVQFGALTLVTAPFELFSEISLKIKELFGKGQTIIAAYTNGEEGYFISDTLYPYAKYERKESFKFTRLPGPPVREAQKILLDALKKEGNG